MRSRRLAPCRKAASMAATVRCADRRVTLDGHCLLLFRPFAAPSYAVLNACHDRGRGGKNTVAIPRQAIRPAYRVAYGRTA